MILAIKGHLTRGKEVIEILKMFGAENKCQLNGNNDGCAYYVNNGEIMTDYIINLNNIICFTFEEFIVKFPYKVGDKVLYKIYNVYSSIKTMTWNEEKEQVIYRLDSKNLWVATADELQPRKEEVIVNNIIDTVKESDDRYRIVLNHQFDMEVDEGEYYAVRRKPQYPNTYEECCKIRQSDPNFYIDTHLYSVKLESLYKLLICRDAYWEVWGEKMGMGKPWKPDSVETFGIFYDRLKNEIEFQDVYSGANSTLEFPTAEMRGAFYENFKELIDECKELL